MLLRYLRYSNLTVYAELAERARQKARTYTRTESPEDDFMAMYRPKTITTDEQKHREATDKARKLESIRDAETATLGQAFVRDANKVNAFSKLSRYETTIERSLYKALHELQRLQAARHAEGNVSLPVAVDAEVSGVSREDL